MIDSSGSNTTSALACNTKPKVNLSSESFKIRKYVKWKDRVLEYLKVRQDARGRGLDVRLRSMDRYKWRLFCLGYPLEQTSA